MRTILNFPTILVALLIVGCSDSVGPRQLQTPIEFDLNYSGSVVLDNGEVKVVFKKVLTDSRCPSTAHCFAPGAATIDLGVRVRGSDEIDVPLTIFGVGQDTILAMNYVVDTLGYRFSLRSLLPYPEYPDIPIPLSGYQTRLRVEKSAGYRTGVTITDTPPAEFLFGEYNADSVLVKNDTLSVWIRYGGGCQPHEFYLIMSPAGFLESSPAQANLYLLHVNHFDACRAQLSKRVDFDITAIADAYRAAYHTDGSVLLNIFEYRSGSMRLANSKLYEIL